MTDSSLRDLERAWLESGASTDHQRYLSELERAGSLPRGPVVAKCVGERLGGGDNGFSALAVTGDCVVWRSSAGVVEVLGPDLSPLGTINTELDELSASGNTLSLCSSSRLEVWSLAGDLILSATAEVVEDWEESACCVQVGAVWWLRLLGKGLAELRVISLSSGAEIAREVVEFGAGEIFELHPHPDGRVFVRGLEPGPDEVVARWGRIEGDRLFLEDAPVLRSTSDRFMGFSPNGELVLSKFDFRVESRELSGDVLVSISEEEVFGTSDHAETSYPTSFLDDHWCLLLTGEGWVYLADVHCSRCPPRRLELPGVVATQDRYRIGFDEFEEVEYTNICRAVSLGSRGFVTLESGEDMRPLLRSWVLE